jgi:glycerol uptake facilitator-like aquaporin
VGINCSTAEIFSTYPSPHVTDWQSLIDQIFATGFLLLTAFAITDEKNIGAAPNWAIPPMIGLVIVALVMSYQYNCGAALNPARDFGPRLFTAIAGWGSKVFQ